jgi:hypothetical protein
MGFGSAIGLTQSQGTPTSAPAQAAFATPEAAVAALLAAFQEVDERALLDLFGREHEQFVVVSDQVAQREELEELYAAAQEANELQPDGEHKRILIIGREAWPFPIPLVKVAAGWQFDTAAGAEEILNRCIGTNELAAITACEAYCAAQVEYGREDHDGDDVCEYAQRLSSATGKQDGLYWEVPPDSDQWPSPLGPLLAEAAPDPDAAGQARPPTPYYGYYYKILTRQGSNLPGGEYDYTINGNMIAGFALVAWPADYGSSGIMTFVVSHQGRIYEKDLGDQTMELGRAMTTFNPDASWRRVTTQ